MVAIPGAVVMAYKERESIFKTVVYVFVGIAVLYLLYKIFKAFEKLGKVDDAIKEGVGEFTNKVKETVEKVKEELKPTPLTEKQKEEISKVSPGLVGGAWTEPSPLYQEYLERTKTKNQVKPKTIKEHMELEGKRWEAKADYYSRKLHLIEGLDSNRYYKLTWIDNKGLRHERIMKGSEIKAMKRDIYKVITILPIPEPKPEPKSTPLPRIQPLPTPV